MAVAVQENKMGVMPVGKLLFQVSFPMFFSMLVFALYHIVDSMFITALSENAFTAVSLSFPVFNFMVSVAIGTGVGINSLLSKKLGAKQFEAVNQVAGNGIFLTFCSALFFTSVGGVLAPAFMKTQTTIQEIVDYGAVYLQISMVFSLPLFLEITFERLLQSTGKTFFTMCSQIAGVLTNVLLDPLLIFGLGPFPQLGIAGAAIASVCGQLVGMILAIFLNIRLNKEIHFSFKRFKLSGKIIIAIYKVGIPSIVLGSISSITIYFYNRILERFSTTAIALLGICFRLDSFVFLPIFGINNGVVPIVAYNYGAKKHKRILQTILIAVALSFCFTFLGFLSFQIFPEALLSLFKASEKMVVMGVPGMRILAISFLFAGVSIALSSVFQALGRGASSMVIYLIRQIFVLLPCAYSLSLTDQFSLVFWSFPIAELVAFLLSIIFFIHINKKYLRPLLQDLSDPLNVPSLSGELNC